MSSTVIHYLYIINNYYLTNVVLLSEVFIHFFKFTIFRIYIKKVRKFPSHAVNLNLDKKTIRLAMDKAFHELREQGLENWGEER